MDLRSSLISAFVGKLAELIRENWTVTRENCFTDKKNWSTPTTHMVESINTYPQQMRKLDIFLYVLSTKQGQEQPDCQGISMDKVV